MNIIEKLKLQNIESQIKYYGLEDLATGIAVGQFLDGKEIILQNYVDFKISNIDEYIDYVYLENITKFEEVIPYVREDKKEEFQKFINDCKKLFDKYKKKEFVNYIFNNYVEIFEYKKEEEVPSFLEFNLREYTIIALANYKNKINDALLNYIIGNQIYILIDNFEHWQEYFKKNPQQFEKLLSKKNIEKIFSLRHEEIFDILIAFYNIDKFKDVVKKISESIFEIIKKMFFGTNDYNSIWESYYTLDECLYFFRKIKSAKTHKIEEELNIQKDIFDVGLKKNGQRVEFEIDLKPFKENFENKSIPREIRILSITHGKDKDNVLTSFVDNAINHEGKVLSDIISRNNPGTNEYFTSARLRCLNLYTFEIKGKLDIILSITENIKEYIDGVYEKIKWICKNLNLNNENEDFDENIGMLYQYLIDLANIDKEHVTSVKNMCYGLSMFLCGFIEKILRTIYKNSISKDIYMPDANTTLKNLLDDKIIINKILGFNQVQCLKYLLIKADYEKNVGLNIRNDLAHLNARTIKKLKYDMVLELLAYFTLIINTTCLYYDNCNMKKD